MKKYINPKMDLKLFSEEKIITDSTLEAWADDNGTTVTTIGYNSLKEVPDGIKFTF